ncbi:MAG TPA: ATP-binding protein [Methylomirabilota bacterium]|jgi:signal transduction histidine kinase|nr:ATP-binding protein [Methylomirabilota bacterium]
MREIAPAHDPMTSPPAPPAGAVEATEPVRPMPLPADEGRRRQRALHQELAVRAGVSLLMLVFNELFTVTLVAHGVIRVAALLAFLVNVPYYLAARTGRRRRLQVWIRMSMDVGFITAGIYAAGGLAAAQYLGVYAIVPVYTGIVFSSRACVAVTLLATGAYLTLVGAQVYGVLPFTRPPNPEAWEISAFNLLVLNIVGGLAAMLADAYRRSRHRLAAAYGELERAHEQSLRMHATIERAGRLYAVSEVVAGVTHEMRNVLQGVFGHLWLVRRKIADAPPDVDEHLGQVEESCEHVMRIIRTTLDMARQPGDTPGPLSVDEVVARATELKAYDLRRDGITLTVDVPDGLPRIRASAFQLQQVLLNLITNAQDELRDRDGRREIIVTSAPDPLGCVIEVHDTGPGIPRAILPRVFEPFFTTKQTGTGLGLAISAGIVERFGGRVTAANRREGGAVFRIVLPAA